MFAVAVSSFRRSIGSGSRQPSALPEPRRRQSTATRSSNTCVAVATTSAHTIEARFRTRDFTTGLEFVTASGAAAEAANHHPTSPVVDALRDEVEDSGLHNCRRQTGWIALVVDLLLDAPIGSVPFDIRRARTSP